MHCGSEGYSRFMDLRKAVEEWYLPCRRSEMVVKCETPDLFRKCRSSFMCLSREGVGSLRDLVDMSV